jgi:hypothetical protein
MRIVILAAVAGVLLASAPAMAAGPVQINGNLAFGGTPHQHIGATGVTSQSVSGQSHIVTFGQPSAIQANVNVGLDSDSTQNVNDQQSVKVHGLALGTQATQIGANVSVLSNTNQSVTQTQTVAQHGFTAGSLGTQIGANVAIGSTGGSQTINASQSVK